MVIGMQNKCGQTVTACDGRRCEIPAILTVFSAPIEPAIGVHQSLTLPSRVRERVFMGRIAIRFVTYPVWGTGKLLTPCEFESRPVVVDRADLVVDKANCESVIADVVLSEVDMILAGALGMGDPD
jgi:hypothetical protein